MNSKIKRSAPVLLVILGILIPLWFISVLFARIDEASTPSDAAFPEVPQEFQATSISTSCGSGGCWKMMHIPVISSEETQEVVTAMNVTIERCHLRSLLTLCKTCLHSRHTDKGVWVFAQ